MTMRILIKVLKSMKLQSNITQNYSRQLIKVHMQSQEFYIGEGVAMNEQEIMRRLIEI